MGLAGWRSALLPAMAAAAGCYAPSPIVGAPCSSQLECPAGQVCDRNAPGGPTCTVSLVDGTPGSLDNDRPAGAADISAGGTFVFDASTAGDDVTTACAAGPGPDVFFELMLAAPDVVYLDTFGSAGNPALAVHPGACDEARAAIGCADDTCGEHPQGAWRLPAGRHCVVVDHAGTPPGPGALHVFRAHRDADPLPARTGTVSGNTCGDDDSNEGKCSCAGAEPDHHYFFTVCPATEVRVQLQTCMGADFDTVVQVSSATDNEELDCVDDTPGCGVDGSSLSTRVSGPGLFWAIIDGCSECGAYTMAYTLTNL